jgi:hypothetical protein
MLVHINDLPLIVMVAKQKSEENARFFWKKGLRGDALLEAVMSQVNAVHQEALAASVLRGHLAELVAILGAKEGEDEAQRLKLEAQQERRRKKDEDDARAALEATGVSLEEHK